MTKNKEKIEMPKKIIPCPIVNAIVEIRFGNSRNKTDNEIYSLIKDELETNSGKSLNEKLQKLNFSHLLTNQYLLKDKNLVIQYGNDIISIINEIEYIGWEKFFKKIKKIWDKILKSDFIISFDNLTVKYINLFEEKDFKTKNIFNKSTIDITLNKNNIMNKNINLSINDNLNNTLKRYININNKVNATIGDAKIHKEGSLINISIHTNDFDKNNLYDKINLCHNEVKKTFFSLLNDKFIEEIKKD